MTFALAEPASGGSSLGAPPARHVVALGALGGRLDHELAALSVLHAFPDARITLLGCHAAATLLAPGAHRLRPCPPTEGPVCGLVPIGACAQHAVRTSPSSRSFILRASSPAAGPAVASSTGLRWDLSATRLAVGELVRPRGSQRAHRAEGSRGARAGEHVQRHRGARGDGGDGRAAGVDHAAALRRCRRWRRAGGRRKDKQLSFVLHALLHLVSRRQYAL